MSKESLTKTLSIARVRLVGLVAAVLMVGALAPAGASAATANTGWFVTQEALPTNFTPGSSSGADNYQIVVINESSQPQGGPITVTDTLPAGLTFVSATASDSIQLNNTVTCSDVGQIVTCTDPLTNVFQPGQTSKALQPGEYIQVAVHVAVAADASGSVTNDVTVSGGSTTATSSQPTTISASNAPPGLASVHTLIAGPDGAPDTTAGSHPYVDTTSFALSTVASANGEPVLAGNVKDINTELPAGFVGAATAVPQCPEAAFVTSTCSPNTQVGEVTLAFFAAPGAARPLNYPVYNVVPPPGEPVEFGFIVANTPTYIHFSVRTGGDYGLDADIPNVNEALAVVSATLTVWGEPADASHTALRTSQAISLFGAGVASTAPANEFLTMPSSCGSSLTTSMSVDFWGAAGQFSTASLSSPPLTSCGGPDFSPSLSVQPDTSSADSPSGLSVDLSMPQGNLLSSTGLAEADLQNATVSLPSGVTVDPSAASGLTGCSPDRIGISNGNAPSCPNSSKVGTAEIDSPLLPDPLTGGIYIAQQDNNPFNSLLAIYVTAYADGVWVKLAGDVQANPVTGQLVTTFSNNPQLPFTDFKLDFAGGSHGILATPQQCGTYTTTSDLSPWSGGSGSSPSDSFDINSGCVSGFAPSLTAGSQNPQAGAYAPFEISFSRADTDQNFSGLTVKLPLGMLAKLAGVQECSNAQLTAAAAASGAQEQASPSCPVGSQVGTVTAGSGVGPSPFFLSGSVYLTGPYRGAPYGLAIVVPAVAGPYDLGTVVVRQALNIDPETAQVTDVSDPFPTILDGIPLDIRQIDVSLNRPGFTVNPTSCNAMSVTGTLTSTGGVSENVSDHFQVGGCQDIGFSPKLAIALSGKGKISSGDHPTLTATLTDPSGQANIKTARVALPLSLALDPSNSQNVCAFSTAQAVHGGVVGCPASTIVGTASAVTPLLDRPLTGNVYLVQGIRTNAQGQPVRTLPSLLVALRGQIALDLRAQTATAGGKLVTTFSTIPDAPVSRFTLQINGGPKGLLVITGRGKTICSKAQVANASFGAQSGKTKTGNMTLSTPCGKPAHLRVLSRRVTGGALLLRMKTSERGRLTVSGHGLRRFSRVLTRGVHTVRVALAKGATTASVVRVTVTLRPANAMPAKHTFRMRT